MLTDNPMLAYNAMQLTGWAQYPEYGKPEGKIHEDNRIKLEHTPEKGKGQEQQYDQSGYYYGQ